jgi:hypothetical protein
MQWTEDKEKPPAAGGLPITTYTVALNEPIIKLSGPFVLDSIQKIM